MRRTRLRDHSINRLIPNMLTLFALCAGLTSIKFALDANALMNVTAYTGASSVADAAARKWELACIAIIVAAVFDALDGRIARLLDSTSKFGAELDSLSDFIAFGVAPSVILYVWTMDQAGRIGWGCSLLFSACMALRLARFFGTSPQFWMNLQSNYELQVAEDEAAEKIEREVVPLAKIA